MDIRRKLVSTALKWQRLFRVAPGIMSALSEYDAALLAGCSEEDYSCFMQDNTAMSRGTDFVYAGKRYQVKGTRPGGKPGSTVTKVPKAANYDWDYLIWINYNTAYEIEEAWQWNVEDYKNAFDSLARLSPEDMRRGKKLK